MRVASRIAFAWIAAVASCVAVLTPAADAASGWTSVSAGAVFTCGIKGGRVYCWGTNTLGQLGDGTTTSRAKPRLVS